MKTLQTFIAALGLATLAACAVEVPPDAPPPQAQENLGTAQSAFGCQSHCSVACGGQSCSITAGPDRCANCTCEGGSPRCSTSRKQGTGFDEFEIEESYAY